MEMDTRATERVHAHLLNLAGRFKEKGESFKELADSHRGQHLSLQSLPATTAWNPRIRSFDCTPPICFIHKDFAGAVVANCGASARIP
jgi:hypothetical protein